MGYKQIRYLTGFKSKEDAEEGMKKADAYNITGVGKWKIVEENGVFNLVFLPSLPLKIVMNRLEATWFKMAQETQAEFRKLLEDESIMAVVE